MDFVPKNERARWKSLESVSQFGWCGSAVLGGYLADKVRRTAGTNRQQNVVHIYIYIYNNLPLVASLLTTTSSIFI